MRQNSPSIKLFINSKGYKYYLANIIIYGVRYRKTFGYTEEGHNQAEQWMKDLKLKNEYL